MTVPFSWTGFRRPISAFYGIWGIPHGLAAKNRRRPSGRIFYTHIKDAIYDPSHPKAMADGWRYVIPGSGQLPLEEAVRLLKKEGYDGWVNFEHEKRWHPELDEPEAIFPAFARWVRPIIE
jgi:sugar phosphate isomerase/epimerase